MTSSTRGFLIPIHTGDAGEPQHRREPLKKIMLPPNLMPFAQEPSCGPSSPRCGHWVAEALPCAPPLRPPTGDGVGPSGTQGEAVASGAGLWHHRLWLVGCAGGVDRMASHGLVPSPGLAAVRRFASAAGARRGRQRRPAREAPRRDGHEGPLRVHLSRPGGPGARRLPPVGG
jgi:hypothetical protein